MSPKGRSWSRHKTENWNHNGTVSSGVRQRNQKTTRSQLLRSVAQNPGGFPLEQRFPLPASVSGALGEAWVPSAPRWPPRTTACPAKHPGSQGSEQLPPMGKGKKSTGNNCPGSRQGGLLLSKHRTQVRKHGQS